MNKRIRRRDLLRASAAAGFATGLAPFVLARPNQLSISPVPSIRLGVIGVGNRSTHLLRLALADATNVLIRTAKGVLIDQRFDMYSARPAEGPYHAIQGVRGSYDSRLKSIWMEGRSTVNKWDPQVKFAKQFEHPLWTNLAKRAKGSGHGGADFFVLYDFLETVRNGGPSPVDVYDAVAWSSIIPLSGKSIAEGNSVQEIPDFTGGKWKNGTS